MAEVRLAKDSLHEYRCNGGGEGGYATGSFRISAHIDF